MDKKDVYKRQGRTRVPKGGTDMVRAAVSLCGIELDNPVIPASGTFGYGYTFAELYDIMILYMICMRGIILSVLKMLLRILTDSLRKKIKRSMMFWVGIVKRRKINSYQFTVYVIHALGYDDRVLYGL